VLSRRARQTERGQTLVLSLAFLALFGLFAVSVLRFAGITEAQRMSTERTAAANAVADGAAQFALADTNRLGCGTVSAGTMSFASGDTLSYSVPPGGCVGSSAGDTPGQDCVLCLLNSESDSEDGQPDPNRDVLNVDTALKVSGEIDSNGSKSGIGAVAGGRLVFLNGASCAGCAPAPTSVNSAFVDPLRATQAPPANTPSRSQPQSCHSPVQLSPGVYSGIDATRCDITLTAGTYVLTGAITVGSGHVLSGTGVTLYLTCGQAEEDQSGWSPCSSNEEQSGGVFVVETGGSATLNPPTGQAAYAGLTIVSDPNLTGELVTLQGNASFGSSGTIYLPKGSLAVGGSGEEGSSSPTVSVGRVVVDSLDLDGDLTSLGITEQITPSCAYYTDQATGQLAGGRQQPARVSFETNCNMGAPSAADSIINFAYGGR